MDGGGGGVHIIYMGGGVGGLGGGRVGGRDIFWYLCGSYSVMGLVRGAIW